jgi:two-component system response regulator MprA
VIAPRVILVEDDVELRSMIMRGLEEEGFEVEGVGTGSALLARAAASRASALVVDIGLPDADGRDVCLALRAQGINAPVIFLTARDALPDRLSGFSSGGDDYLTKPFALAELVARLHALVRRSGPELVLDVGPLRIDPAAHTASIGDATAALTPTEFRLLAALAARPGEAVRRRTLTQAGWPHGAIVHENTLDAYVARLRRKLRTLPGAPEIATVHRVGYALR